MATNPQEQKAKRAAYMRNYRKTHPDYDREQSIRYAISILSKHGYRVFYPTVKECDRQNATSCRGCEHSAYPELYDGGCLLYLNPTKESEVQA